MNKKSQNLLFIFLIIFFFTIVGLINYFADSQRIFANKDFMNLFGINKKYINLYIHEYKNFKNNLLVVGSSETHTMFTAFGHKKYFNLMATQFVSYKELYEILKYYLELHPETKKIIFFICYSSFFFDSETEEYIPETNDIFKQKIENLFSLEAIKSILFGYFNSFFHDEKYFPEYYPFLIDDMSEYKPIYKDVENESLIYAKKIIDLFKEKGIDYEFVIPPYNAVYIAIIYSNKDYYNSMLKIKKFFTEYGPIYDYSRINDFTKQNMLDNTNYLYYNPSHPNNFWGYKMLINLLFNNHSDENLYYKLTNINLDEITKKENKNIEKYISENKDYVDYYLYIQSHLSNEDTNHSRTINVEILPETMKQEILFIEEKDKDNRDNINK